MPLVQVRDVSETTVNALKARAAERGLTLTSYLRAEPDRFAAHPSNADVVLALGLEAPLITSDRKMCEAQRLGVQVQILPAEPPPLT